MKSTINYCWECGGKAESVFADGRVRKVCTECETILYENPFPTTAALVVNSNDELLLVKRSVRPAKGHWCLPGGFLELGESPEQGVLRELKEETNLDGEVESLIGIQPSLHGFWGDVVVIGFAVSTNGGMAAPGDDAAEVKYFSLSDLPQIAFNTHIALLDEYLGNHYHQE